MYFLFALRNANPLGQSSTRTKAFVRTNDFFEIYPGTSTLRIKSLEIFTRWGEIAFAYDADQSQDSPRWDGSFRGKTLMNEVIVYKAVIEFIDGEIKMFTGSVTIVK